jgi:hypothetical protein
MKIYELLGEGKEHGNWGALESDVNASLPGVYVQRKLRNTDPYMQYRYGTAIAAARAHKAGDVEFEQESAWAENLTLVGFTPEDEEVIKMADSMMGVSATRIADNASREAASTNTVSPVANWMKKK